MSLGPVLTAIVTPFDDNLKVNEAAFVSLFHHLLGHGSDGVVVGATTGEPATLSDAERFRLFELACAERPSGATVAASTGSNNTAHACAMTERATELGVDAVLSVTPYYNRPNRRGLLRHYSEVSRATDKPIVLYNIPSRTGLDMPNDLLAELAGIDRVDYVKRKSSHLRTVSPSSAARCRPGAVPPATMCQRRRPPPWTRGAPSRFPWISCAFR